MIFVIIWLICGFGCAAIAKSKNKSAGGWFFIGILFGPLALLIVGFMKAEEAPTDTLEAKKRIEKLKVMGDADALAEMIVDETDLRVCRNAAEALAALGDERGKNYLESPAAKAYDEPKPEEIQALQDLVKEGICPLCGSPFGWIEKFFASKNLGWTCNCGLSSALAKRDWGKVVVRKKTRAAKAPVKD